MLTQGGAGVAARGDLIEGKAISEQAVRVRAGGKEVSLTCTRFGPWSRFFGEIDQPSDGMLDRLAAWFTEHHQLEASCQREGITVVGSPAASLLVVLWLRTIWLDADTPIRLVWDGVRPPIADTAEQLAGRLCSLVVDEVVCDDEDLAMRAWGIEGGRRSAAAQGEEIFDLMGGLIDAWDLRVKRVAFPMEWLTRTREAFAGCAERGRARVALYGAGTHTRALGAVLMQPEVEIVCIIDDDEERQGDRLWGFEIVSPTRAREIGVDAVVLSANTFEDALWEKTAWMREAGIEVVRLYGDSA